MTQLILVGAHLVCDFTDSERAYLAIFEKLPDSVDAIPASLIITAEERYAALEPVR